MNKKATLSLIILFTTYLIPTYAQDFWEELSIPDSIEIRCFITNNLGHIFLGAAYDGNSGGVYRSINNAHTWELVLDNANHSVHSIAINDDGYIYAGKAGFVNFVVSYDNGDSWEEIEIPPPSYGNIVKILCVGQDTIFVSSWESPGAFITRSFDGGETWEHSFITDHEQEVVSDIAISGTGDIYVSVNGYFVGQGGVYKSIDGGASWEYVGLLNHQVMTIEINSNNDVFTGDWWVLDYSETPAIHALYDGTDEFISVLNATDGTDIVINSEDHIYATANEEVVCSFDNGQTFEYINDELSSILKTLYISYDGFLFGTKTHRIVKSITPIITSINNYSSDIKGYIYVFPNPVIDYLFIRAGSTLNSTRCCKVCIYDIFGKTVFENKNLFFEDIIHLNISELESGFYLISIQKDNRIFNSSFIKQKPNNL